jgi:two-component system, OmpR family, sensor kinase
MNIKSLKIYYPAFIVLITLLAFSYFAYYQARVSAVEKRERLFDARVKDVTNAINLRILDYVQILRGCQGLFYGSDSITATDWKVYVENLDINGIYPGIQGIGYAPYLPAKDKPKLEKNLRKSGFPGYSIRSSLKNQYITPIIYLEPLTKRNLRAFGYDMYDNEARRKAMDRAILTGKASMTGKLTLVQETHTGVQPGFLLYMPVYKNPAAIADTEQRKNNIKGFVYYPFRAYDLIKTISRRNKDVHLKIYDSRLEQNSLLFDSDSLSNQGINASANRGEFVKLVKMNVAGRPWNLVISSTDRLASSIETNQPMMIFMFGIILSVFFFIMIYNIIKRNNQIRLELEVTKELDNKKDEFIGIASHELKTPLTSIKAYMQLLERSQLRDMERTLVVKANSNINKLNNLIGDLLDVSKVQSGQLILNIAPFELNRMIRESVDNVQHMYSSHKLVILNEIPDITLKGDILRLEQAMNNLLLNAIKYSPGVDSVYINTQLLPNHVRIEIIDKGIGIAEENQERIFDRFYRAKELSPVISGLGMGLFISQEIIKRHHGTIGVESEFGKGSTFYIILPV